MEIGRDFAPLSSPSTAARTSLLGPPHHPRVPEARVSIRVRSRPDTDVTIARRDRMEVAWIV